MSFSYVYLVNPSTFYLPLHFPIKGPLFACVFQFYVYLFNLHSILIQRNSILLSYSSASCLLVSFSSVYLFNPSTFYLPLLRFSRATCLLVFQFCLLIQPTVYLSSTYYHPFLSYSSSSFFLVFQFCLLIQLTFYIDSTYYHPSLSYSSVSCFLVIQFSVYLFNSSTFYLGSIYYFLP